MHGTRFTQLALAASFVNSITAAPTTPPHQPIHVGNPYRQIADYSYPNFFDGFTAYNASDPTYGFVEYVAAGPAKEQALVGWIFNEYTNRTSAFIGADSSSIAPAGRSSMRLTSEKKLDVGTLTVFDVLHIPVGAGPGGSGLWPAVWFLAPEPTWPYGGEIDIIEYVNPAVDGSDSYNAMTLHTGPGCVVKDSKSDHLGRLANTNCSYTNDGNLGDMGCSIPAPLDYKVNGKPVATSGERFNAQGGGVFVSEWTSDGISVWLFPHADLPADIQAGRPDPSSWTQKPLAKFSGSGCDFEKAFAKQQLIINVDVCGSWAGNTYPGGLDACNEFAANHPEAYENAYFEFASIKMYSSEE